MDILKFKFLLLLIFQLCLYLNSGFSKEKAITLSTGDWPPCTDSSAQDKGWCSLIVLKAFAKVGIKIELIFSPWQRALFRALDGEANGTFPWSLNEDRKEKFIYSSETVSSSPTYYLYYRKNFKFDWKKYEDLKKVKIGLTAIYNYSKFNEVHRKDKEFKVNYVITDLQNLKKLLAKRIDVFPLPHKMAKALLEKYFTEEERKKLVFHPVPFEPEKSLYIMFPKKNKNSKKFKSLFDKGLRKLKESGEYSEIISEAQALNIANNLTKNN